MISRRLLLAPALLYLLVGRAGWGADREMPAGISTVTSPPASNRNTQVQAAVERALQFLSQSQTEAGCFASGNYGRNVGVTALAGLAFAAHGSTPDRGPYGHQLTRCVDYVVSQQSPSGLIQEERSASYGPMYGHGFATLFLAEVYGESERDNLRRTIERAVRMIVQSQNTEGAWRYRPDSPDGDVSVTICQMMALRAARDAGFAVPAATVDRCIAYVRACQNTDGGFRYQRDPKDAQGERSEFARSAAGLVTLYSAGVYSGDSVDQARRYLQQFLPNRQPSDRPNYYLYGHYYAIQAMWLQGDAWSQDWYDAVRDDLLATQLTDGSWNDEQIANEYTAALAVIILQTPNTHLPIFQR